MAVEVEESEGMVMVGVNHNFTVYFRSAKSSLVLFRQARSSRRVAAPRPPGWNISLLSRTAPADGGGVLLLPAARPGARRAP